MYLDNRYLKEEKHEDLPKEIKDGITEYYNDIIPIDICIISIINDFGKSVLDMDGKCLILTSREKTYFVFYDKRGCWVFSE